MKKYSSYKPSGIEWLETIPENWEVSKLKYLGNLFGGLTGKSGGDFNNDENPKNKPYIPYTNIFNNTYISKDHFHYVSIDEGESQNRVKKNDMFFLMSSETHKDLGKSCILIDDVDELYLNSFCKGYRIKDKNIQPLFLNYQILGHLHREMISLEGKGFTRINLRQDKINDLVVFYPSLQEQGQIVNYLDEKTTIIDKLISTKQRKVELLKEQRTTIINQVITKGLNSNVKMKNSGVEWIGEIPESWIVGKLNFYCDRIGDGLHSTPIYDDNGEYHFINGNNIKNGKIIITENTRKVNEVEFNNHFIKLSNSHTLLLSINGTIGNVSYYNDEKVILGKSVGYINLKHSSVDIDFLYWLLLSKSIQNYFQYELTGTTIYNLSLNSIRKTPILIPSSKEQREIVEYLDNHTKEIDDLVSMEQNKIELLKEYKQSLISEVITGKIKVV